MVWLCFGVGLDVEIGLWMSKCARDGVNRRYISVPLLSLLSSSPLPLPRLHPPQPPPCACSHDEATSSRCQVGVFSLASGILGRGEDEGTRAFSSTSSRRKIRVSSLVPEILVPYRSHQTTLPPREGFHAGVRRTQELPGVSFTKQNEMTEDNKIKDSSRFWVILIGVDGDPHYSLHGCVSDAELMENYLVEDLGVPSNCFQRLLGPTGGGDHRRFY
ncbi:hypothetical protein ARMGADRAFT_1164229 [Armillaria gallica]|uniref:Uncharacterized protein n=1 Tax=Armillaria gallica TaxID=47427 RepID=A0A2H3DKH2_ARMGA|nr:hypothetical protein ARMGADRAFT_1164229 [Armillaria gallica]